MLGMFQPIDLPSSRWLSAKSATVPARESSKSFSMNRDPESAALPGDDDDDKELHAALLEAGVSLDIVTKIMELPYDEAEAPQIGGAGTAGASGDTEMVRAPTGSVLQTSLAQESIAPTTTESSSTTSPIFADSATARRECSVFDTSVRDEVMRMAKQDDLFDQIVRCNETTESSSAYSVLRPSFAASLEFGLLPKIESQDRENLLEIIMYTFGTVFTEYLCCDCSEVRVRCIEIVERFIDILKESMDAVLAFEGAVALLRISLQDPDQGVFQSSLHLAQTIFQQSVSESKLRGCSSPFVHTLGVLDALPEDIAKCGLRHVTEALLANPCCWSKQNRAVAPHLRSRLSSSGKRRMDVDFLQFVRIMVSQECTRATFYQVLFPAESGTSDNQVIDGGSEKSTQDMEKANRLRLFRFLLQRHKAGLLVVPGGTLMQIERYCEGYRHKIAPTRFGDSEDDSPVVRLAKDCALLLAAGSESRPNPSKVKQLSNICTQVDDFETAGKRKRWIVVKSVRIF